MFGNDEQQAAVEQLMKHAHEQCVEHTVRSGGARAQTSSMFKRSTLFIWAAVYTAVRGHSKQTLRARCLFALTLSSSTHAPHHRARTTRLTCTKMPCALAFTTRAPPQAPAPSPSLTPGAPTDSSCCLAREADCPTTKNSLSQPRHSTTRFESVNRLLAGSYCPLFCLVSRSPHQPPLPHSIRSCQKKATWFCSPRTLHTKCQRISLKRRTAPASCGLSTCTASLSRGRAPMHESTVSTRKKRYGCTRGQVTVDLKGQIERRRIPTSCVPKGGYQVRGLPDWVFWDLL